jgi:hypothetical protein
MRSGQPRPMRLALAAVLGLLITGCATSLPLQGQTEKETFSGSATGYLDQSGTLAIRGDKGTTCTGTFAYVTPVDGQGTITCSDGRSGPIMFISNGTYWAGTGKIGDARFTFIFG